MDRVLVILNVPTIERKYNIWIENDKTIDDTIKLIVKGINELNDGLYKPKKMLLLYNKETGNIYDKNLTVNEANIKNGTEIILI